jgi:isopenicillin N synthase-like dioxygenase
MIDLAGGPAGAADEVRRACEDVGFLTVVGHGVDAQLIDQVASSSRAFFDLPHAEKERFRACLNPSSSDYDCAGGEGNGPDYTDPVRVVGPDDYDLDREGDGLACESS